MKKVIFLLLIANSALSQSPAKKIFNIKDSLTETVKFIVNTVGSKCDFVSLDSLKKNGIDYVYNNEGRKFIISYSRYNIGGNENLEISPELTYQFEGIRGKYLTLFPIWKYFFESQADLIVTQKNGHGTLCFIEDHGRKWTIAFNKYEELWMISIYPR